MKKIAFILFLIATSIVRGQDGGNPVKLQDQLTVQFDVIMAAKIDEKLKIRQLFEISSEKFNELKPLGEPKKLDYKDNIAYEAWTFYYDNLILHFQNTHGKVEFVNMKLTLDSETSHFLQLGNINIDNNTLSSSIFTVSENELKKRNLINVVDANEGFVYQDIEFEIQLDDQNKKVTSLKLTRKKEF